MKNKTEQLFLEKVIPEPMSGCWLWLGGIRRTGYGQLNIRGKVVAAHRFSYSIEFGEIPEGLHVLHKCDVRCCVNPNHLFLGDQSDNMKDMERKGRKRVAIGEKSGKAKLTESRVLEIRERTKDRKPNQKGPLSNKQLGKEFGVSCVSIGDIVRRISWKHLA